MLVGNILTSPLDYWMEKKKSEKESTLHSEVSITNALGLHARAAAKFVKLASQYKAKSFVDKDGETVSGRSVMGLMMLAASPGSKIKISTQGAEAKQALEALKKLVEGKFNEE